MRYATDPYQGAKTEPTSGASALCPTCAQPVRAKCGRINAWHWAHVSQVDCDPWSEPISAWHLSWQGVFSSTHREVVIGTHRADIAVPGGILELQHSHLAVDEIRERETFYRQFGYFVWLFDVTEAYTAGRLDLRTKADRSPQYRTFRWKRARKSIAAASAPVYLDLGSSIMKLGAMKLGGYGVGGWGHLRTHAQFVTEFALSAYRTNQAAAR